MTGYESDMEVPQAGTRTRADTPTATQTQSIRCGLAHYASKLRPAHRPSDDSRWSSPKGAGLLVLARKIRPAHDSESAFPSKSLNVAV